jgi:hypothetical protein
MILKKYVAAGDKDKCDLALSESTGRCMGRGGPVNWPARSPDLNLLDFWLWGHLKPLVYSDTIYDLEVLQQ